MVSADVKYIENLIKNVDEPLMVTDFFGKIIKVNKLFVSEFNKEKLNSIFDSFDNITSNFLAQLLEQIKSTHENLSEDLTLKGKDFSLSIEVNDEKNIICWIFNRKIIKRKKINRIKINSEDVEFYIKNDKIKKILYKIEDLFPFTLISKSNIQKEIDSLNEIFWITDCNGRFILTNNKFSSRLGFTSRQLEGKYEKDFIPSYLTDFYTSIKKFIKTTTKPIIYQGMYSTILNLSNEKEIVEIPLTDIEGEIYAFVGVSKDLLEKDFSTEKEENYFKDLPLPAFSFNEAFELLNHSKELLKYFPLNFSAIKNLQEFLPEEFFNHLYKVVIEQREDYKFNIDLIENNRKTNFDIKVNLVDSSAGIFNVYLIKSEKLDHETSGKVKMYDAIMTMSPEPIIVYDVENLKFIQVNDAAQKLYGYSREEFLEMDLTDLYTPEDIQTLINTASAGSDDTDFKGPWRHRKKNGEIILVEISKMNFDYNGIPAQVNIIRDVTEKINANKEIQLLKTAFENSSDLIITTDADGFIIHANESVTKELGFSVEELISRPIISLVSDDHRAKLNSEVFHSGKKNKIELDLKIKNKKNDLKDAEVLAFPIINYSGEIDSFNFVFKLESEVIVKEKVVEVPVESNTQITKVEPSLDSSFLGNVFHEILTPINVILGFVQEITESIENPTEDQKEATDIIKENQKALLQTMDSVMEYINAVKEDTVSNVKEVAFVECFDEIEENVKKDIEKNDKTLRYGKISSSLRLETDKDRFISLISALIRASVNISLEDNIFVSAYQKDNNSVLITIKDKKEKITDRLYWGINDIADLSEEELRRKYGLSRLISRLISELKGKLNMRFLPVEKNGSTVEYGFQFPVKFKKFEKDEERYETFSIENETNVDTEVNQQVAQAQQVQNVNEVSNNVQNITQPEINVSVNIPTPTETSESVKKEEKEEKETEAEVVTETVSKNTSYSGKWTEEKLSEMNCLYLEDQIDSQILFEVQMKDLNEVDFAASFEEALPLLNEKKYDFIVMDINLKGEYNGLDAFRIIQRMPKYKDVPVIASTAYILPGDREKFIAAGFSDFISKPIMRSRIIEILEQILN